MKIILYGIIVIIFIFSIIKIFYEIGNKIKKSDKYNFKSFMISIAFALGSLGGGIVTTVLSDFISSEILSANKSTTAISETANSYFFDEKDESLSNKNISTEEIYVSVSGKITYDGQEDKYLYTAAVSGTYHFSTEISAGGSVKITIAGENGNTIKFDYNELTIDLEAGKTYILCIGYADGFSDYTVRIDVPNEIKDITGKNFVSE